MNSHPGAKQQPIAATAGGPALRLVPPAGGNSAAPELSPDQAAVVGLRQGTGPLLIWGAPGVGKSSVLVEAAVRRIEQDGVDPAQVLLLTPSRISAARLRDALSARLNRTVSTSPARSWASYAFDVLRRAQAEGVLPKTGRGPKLISGPEQDLFIRELLEGHALGFSAGPQWPLEMQEALGTRGFRQEVRLLFDRMVDNGLLPADLERLAVQNQRPEWLAAAQLFAEYRDLIELKNPGCYDPAGILRAVSDVFDAHPEWLQQERDRHRLILVDDLQETGRAAHGVLRRIGTGRDLLMTACPDVVVQGFRGARPDLVGALRDELAAAEAVLDRSHRLSPPLAQAWRRVADRIAQSRGGHKARGLVFPAGAAELAGAAEPAAEPAVSSIVVGSDVQQRRFIAERIMHFQIDLQRPLSQIAVIVRTGSQLAAVGRYLASHGIPVRIPAAETPVRDEPAVRPLLLAFRLALRPELLDADAAVELLSSRIGGLSSVQLRRIRKLLRAEELSAGGGRSSDELLVEAFQRPAQLAALGVDGRAAARVSSVLQAGVRALAEPGADPQTVLWALWEATGLSAEWAAAAVREGSTGSRADRDLDAMMALFQAAERYVEQSPAASPEAFLDYLLDQELPMDTLAARAGKAEAVEVMTPASATGRQWPVVIVAGLQEGVWPNNRLRGELLGSQYLVEVLELGSAAAQRLTAAQRMRDIRYDELRSFSTAISRASERLICVGVSSEDEQPSGFLDLVDPLPPEAEGAVRPLTEVRRPKNLRSLVAELRQTNEARPIGIPGSATPDEAATVLAELSRRRVPGADPESWWGLAALSSTDPVLPPEAVVPVSPSRIEAVHDSPLSWFLQAAGGEAQQDLARSLGTLIHGIAQDLPDGKAEDLLAALDDRWPALGLPENWHSDAQRRRAERMLLKLAGYLRLMSAEGRRLIGVEQGFGVEVHGDRIAALKGIVDRLEVDAQNRLLVVDLKTGKHKPTAAELERHPQLGAYQVAAEHGAFAGLAEQQGLAGATEVAGAALVQLGDGTQKHDPQFQAAVDPADDWATPLVREAAVLMSAAEFVAVHDPSATGRRPCPLPDVCPLCRGKQVTE
ncbi:ATP-dependent helicase [Arthrobacter russicus]|uniref:DNA 3'-5' helicase n=1 Tax=Arthrobacter russicus TaxID=172040 RepID=A0ABU1J988_9MICC|nr:ATP-dependent DNA helicase [Arthrobacter russicus]MDR6268705.1 superfamily I DNA/RNA helicase/RecB family exonuclease [Arthrobacter russicus]